MTIMVSRTVATSLAKTYGSFLLACKEANPSAIIETGNVLRRIQMQRHVEIVPTDQVVAQIEQAKTKVAPLPMG